MIPLTRLRSICALLAVVGAVGACEAAVADDVRALMIRGDSAAALARADQAVAAAPREAEPRFLKAVVLMQTGSDAEALSLFTELTQEFPELPDPYNNIALLQARAGQLELARQALLLALRADPAHREARANLAQVYAMLAVREWTAAAKADPMNVDISRRLAAARDVLGPRP